MNAVTPNLGLAVPDFDQVPWDVDVNGNWAKLDTAVGLFGALGTPINAWQNVHTYHINDSALDTADGSVWKCILDNISPSAPTTFAQDRATRPGRWLQVTNGYHGVITASTITTGSLIATSVNTDSFDATGSGHIAGNLNVDGVLQVGSLYVNGLANLDNANVNGLLNAETLHVTGSGTIDGTLSVDTLDSQTFGSNTITSFGLLKGDSLSITNNGTVGGTLQANTLIAGNFTAGTITSSGLLHVLGSANVDASVNANAIAATTLLQGASLYVSGTANVFGSVNANAVAATTLLQGASVSVSGTVTAAAYATISDARFKFVLGEYDDGLDEVVQLRPVRYQFKGVGAEHIGILAQEAEKALPDMVHRTGDDVHVTDSGVVIWALVNAVRELAGRMTQLESRLADRAP